jgi:F-box/leucine-rich repeat protein 2/20
VVCFVDSGCWTKRISRLTRNSLSNEFLSFSDVDMPACRRVAACESEQKVQRTSAASKNSDDDGVDNIVGGDVVPLELLAMVFQIVGVLCQRSLLIDIPQVCTRWRDVCNAAVVVNLDVSWSYGTLTDDAATSLLSRFRAVGHSVNLRGSALLSEIGVEKVVKATRSTTLTKLDLSSCKHLTDAVLVSLMVGYPKLATLLLRWCSNVTSAGLASVVAGCSNLASLDITGCINVTDGELKKLATGCTQLTSLTLTGCTLVTDAGMETISKGCNLTLLNFGWCRNVTDVGVEKLAKECPNLTSLACTRCRNVSDVGLGKLAKGCPNLTWLEVDGCHNVSDVGVGKLGEGCPNLTTLALANCYRVTGHILPILAAGCTKLRKLDMTGCNIVADVWTTHHIGWAELDTLGLSPNSITDAGLAKLVRRCPKLWSETFSGFNQCGDRFIAAVVEAHPNLTEFRLVSDLPLVSDAGLATLVRGCRGLPPESIRFGKVKGDKFLAAVAEMHPNIMRLNLMFCRAVTDAGLASLAARCAELAELNLSGCCQVSDAGLAQLAAGCTQLTSVKLSGCRAVTDAGLVMLVEGCPQLSPAKIFSKKKGPLFESAVAKRRSWT